MKTEEHLLVELQLIRGKNFFMTTEQCATFMNKTLPEMIKAIERLIKLEKEASKSNDEICQTLGKALGYPWFKDDQANFPDSTEEHGVCVGDHVAESIAVEAANRIVHLEEIVKKACLMVTDTSPLGKVLKGE